MPHTPPPPPRGRLAPSPTGCIHLGNAFAFLIARLQARASGAALVLRMEDIDPARSRPEFAAGILEDLAWLGIDWDEGPDCGGPFAPYVQSLRLPRYVEALADLRERGLVYPCFCTRKELRTLASAPHIGDEGVPYPGTCRNLTPKERETRLEAGARASWRLDVGAALDSLGDEGRSLAFTDLLRGRLPADPSACGGDFALMRSDGVFSYQLAVSVDDADMRITQVARGEDLLSSTPRQALLLRLLGAEIPEYLHLPLVLDHEGERLAKRHHALEVRELREAGVSPQAILGCLGHLAGCLPKPAPLTINDLFPLFRPASLAGLSPRVPGNIVEALKRL